MTITFNPLADNTPLPASASASDPSDTGRETIGHPQSSRPLASFALALSTILTGLFAGFFFTYSASVVLGFAQVDDLTYVRSFQAINDTIRNPAFAVVFFGTIPVTALALVLHRSNRLVSRSVAVGLACTLTVVAITFLGSVPLNNELATYVDLDTATAAVARDEFESTWNLLNLIRTLVAIIGAGALAAGALLAGRIDR